MIGVTSANTVVLLRRVLSWRLSNSLSADFGVEALEEAIARYGAPEIFNTDQDSQFTAATFIGVLQEHKVPISMNGRGVPAVIGLENTHARLVRPGSALTESGK